MDWHLHFEPEEAPTSGFVNLVDNEDSLAPLNEKPKTGKLPSELQRTLRELELRGKMIEGEGDAIDKKSAEIQEQVRKPWP